MLIDMRLVVFFVVLCLLLASGPWAVLLQRLGGKNKRNAYPACVEGPAKA